MSTPEHPGAPRWVKITVIAVGLVIVALAAANLVIGGDHGPGRHFGGDDPPPAHTMPQGGGHTPPPGAHP